MAQRLIINLRGANGSGKTTLARSLLTHKVADMEPISYGHASGSKWAGKTGLWPVAKCEVPGLKLPIYVQGRYENVTQGGCDREEDMDAIEACVQNAVDNYTDGHVFFEGFVVSKSGERWLTFATRVGRGNSRFLWLFLEPGKQELIRRIMERNGGKPIKEERLDNTIACVSSVRRKARQLFPKEYVVSLDPALSAEASAQEMLGVISAREQE